METTTISSLVVVFVPFLAGLGLGCLLAVLSKWGLTKYALELDYRLGDLEGRLNREVKVRANQNSLDKKKENQSLEEWAQQNRTGAAPATPFATNFDQWRKSKMTQG